MASPCELRRTNGWPRSADEALGLRPDRRRRFSWSVEHEYRVQTRRIFTVVGRVGFEPTTKSLKDPCTMHGFTYGLRKQNSTNIVRMSDQQPYRS